MWDKILVVVVLIILLIGAIYCEFRKYIKTRGYRCCFVKIVDVVTDVDIKNGTTYHITYDWNGKELFLQTKQKPPMKSFLSKSNINLRTRIYFNTDTNDIIPFTSYIPLIIADLIILALHCYMSFGH